VPSSRGSRRRFVSNSANTPSMVTPPARDDAHERRHCHAFRRSSRPRSLAFAARVAHHSITSPVLGSMRRTGEGAPWEPSRRFIAIAYSRDALIRYRPCSRLCGFFDATKLPPFLKPRPLSCIVRPFLDSHSFALRLPPLPRTVLCREGWATFSTSVLSPHGLTSRPSLPQPCRPARGERGPMAQGTLRKHGRSPPASVRVSPYQGPRLSSGSWLRASRPTETGFHPRVRRRVWPMSYRSESTFRPLWMGAATLDLSSAPTVLFPRDAGLWCVPPGHSASGAPFRISLATRISARILPEPGVHPVRLRQSGEERFSNHTHC
jgi:hypothetical protein